MLSVITGDWIADYAAHLRSLGQRPRTVDQRRRILRLADAQLTTGLVGATTDDLLDWIGARSAPETRASYTSCLRGFYGWADRHGLLLDVARDLPSVRVPTAAPRPVPDAVLAAALDAASGVDRAMMLLMAYCGLRSCEVASVEPADLWRSGDGWTLTVADPKGGGTQMVPCPSWVAAEVGPLLPFGFVAGTVRDRVRAVLRSVGSAASPHALRHWYGTTALRGCHDLRVVQRMMRHRDIATTVRYTLVVDDATRAAAESLPRVA